MVNEYSKKFLEFLLNNKLDKNEIRDIIKNYSYFIYTVSESYNYNLTYLESYCDKLYKLKESVIKKNETFNIILNYALKNIDISNVDNFSITMDEFWKYEKDEVFHSGKIDFGKVLSQKVCVECKYICKNIVKMYYDEFNFKDKEIDESLIKFIMQIKEEMISE